MTRTTNKTAVYVPKKSGEGADLSVYTDGHFMRLPAWYNALKKSILTTPASRTDESVTTIKQYEREMPSTNDYLGNCSRWTAILRISFTFSEYETAFCVANIGTTYTRAHRRS